MADGQRPRYGGRMQSADEGRGDFKSSVFIEGGV
jgi:hypothetical protein